MAELADIAGIVAERHGAARAADFRDQIATGRKLAIQILEFFDRVVTFAECATITWYGAQIHGAHKILCSITNPKSVVSRWAGQTSNLVGLPAIPGGFDSHTFRQYNAARCTGVPALCAGRMMRTRGLAAPRAPSHITGAIE